MRRRESFRLRGVCGVFLLAGLLTSCSASNPLPLLEKRFGGFPQYSVILEDMRVGGNFFREYEHRYKVVYAEEQPGSEGLVFRDRLTDWTRVDEDFYRRYDSCLGMTILTEDGGAKASGGGSKSACYPAGYRYVGNDRYGSWRSRSTGGYGWVFFPRYSRMGRTFGMPDESIGRSDWDAYRDHRRRREPYFGPDQKYGTQGSYTKTTHRSFFERQKARKAASRRSFTDKVRNRAGRAGSYRSRGGRGGK